MSKWISVEYKTPDRYEDVLLYTDDKCVVFGTVWIDDEDHFINDCCDGTKVTHWKPLPNPPEEN